MPVTEYSEKAVIEALRSIIEEIEPFMKSIGSEKLEGLLGLFIVKQIDTESFKTPRNLDAFKRAILRAGAHLVATQLFFYHILEKQSSKSGARLYPPLSHIVYPSDLQGLFDIVLKKDYRALFGTRIIGMLPLASVPAINESIDKIKTINLEITTQDIIGRIFHDLIPFNLRKRLAAYYSSNATGNLMAALAITSPKVRVFDPACGSGTLLLSCYHRIKELDPKINHQQLLDQLYGIDISSFAAQLATINLTIQEPLVLTNTCNISISDIFRVDSENSIPSHNPIQVEIVDRSTTEGLQEDSGYKVPPIDVIIANPPFTRGERMDQKYKAMIRDVFKKRRYERYIEQNMGLHAYFIIDTLRFLKDKGIFAMILPFSVLYTSTLRKMRDFLLEHYDIQYVITSDVQVSFSEDTSAKEIILVCQRKGKSTDSSPLAKFVCLKVPLSANNESLADKIVSVQPDPKQECYSDEELRINMVEKHDLTSLIDSWDLVFHSPRTRTFGELLRQRKAIKRLADYSCNPYRGSWYKGAKYVFIPNSYFDITRTEKNTITLRHKSSENEFQLPRSEITEILRKAEYYPQVYIEKNNNFAVTPRNNALSSGLRIYIQLMSTELDEDKSDLLETLKISHRWFKHSSDWGFIHRIDFTTTRILCYINPVTVNLTQNFFSADLPTKETGIVVAWFNSSIFIATLLMSWRQHRGPFGQTAVKEFRRYLCLCPDELSHSDQELILDSLHDFNDHSKELPPLIEQFKACLDSENDSEYAIARRGLDQAILLSLKFPESDIPELLQSIYKEIYEMLHPMRRQR